MGLDTLAHDRGRRWESEEVKSVYRKGGQAESGQSVCCVYKQSFSFAQLASVLLARPDGPPFCSHGSAVWTPRQ